MNSLGAALQKAIDNKKNDINNFVGKKQNGENVRMMDMQQNELQSIYNHATDMLGNKNLSALGKYVVKKNINNAIENCNAQLFLNYLFKVVQLTNLKSNQELLNFINDSKKINGLTNDEPISTLFEGLPSEFENITINKLLTACFDKLEVINKKMIPDKFILSQNIGLTNEEKRELSEYDENGKQIDFKSVIKTRLFLNPDAPIRFYPNGLSYDEFRALVIMDKTAKVSSLPTLTLRLLRDKILLLAEHDLNYHIKKGESLKEQIERVAEYKNMILHLKNY